MISTTEWAVERGVLSAIALTGSIARVPPRLDARIGSVGPEAIIPLASAMGLGDLDPVRERLTAGRRCFAAWYKGIIVAYGWVSQCVEYIGEQEREFRIPPGEAYIWDCATLPRYRGQHLYSALLSQILHTLQEEGVRRVWIGTSSTNHASLNGFARTGFHPVLTLTYVRYRKLRVLWIGNDPHAPRDWVADARQALIAPDEPVLGPLVLARPCIEPHPETAELKA